MSDIIDDIDNLARDERDLRCEPNGSRWLKTYELLCAELVKHWPALSARLREAERKGRALDLLNAETVWVSRWRTPKDGLCWSASTWMDGMVEERFSNDLLTAIEAAIAAKETEQ